MASLTITVADIYVPRIREAFGKNERLATVPEIQAEIKEYIRARVINYEARKSSDAKRTVIEKEVW